MNCQVNRNGFNTGYFNDTDPERIKAESERLSHLPLWIYDDASMTVAQMAGKIHALAGKIECVVIDYIQIIEPEDSRISREQQVADIASSLRVLCKKVKLPFLVLSQLSDEGKLRESRVVGHAAHNVMVIEIDGKKAKLKITKGRGIPKKHYTLDYTPEYCRLESERFYDDDKH